MANWYQKYFNEGKIYPAGKRISDIKNDSKPSNNQFQLYKNLYEFLEQKGMDVTIFYNRRSKQEIRTNINGMFTMLRKYGWREAFLKRYYGKEDE